MSPIDDELRTALSSRTEDVGLSPDFFAGVERKARRMRRNRIAASVAGSALAVGSLGVGGPLLASALTTTAAPAPSDVATSAPTAAPDTVHVLDPANPWDYRGLQLDELGDGTVDTIRSEVAVRYGVDAGSVALSPLYGQRDEPSGAVELVYVAQVDAVPVWGVARSSESGPELLVDRPLPPGTTALPSALPGEAVGRLVVVAAPATSVEYCPTGVGSCSSAGTAGIGRAALDGDPARDTYRVLDAGGRVVGAGAAPDADPGPDAEPGPGAEPGPDAGPRPDAGPGPEVEPGAEGPGTGQPPAVDSSAYALRLDDPWSYRGPLELQQHPDLATQDMRLFEQRGSGRSDGSWSDRPLLALERPDGLSLLMVLHRKGAEAVLTTTWQRQDEAPLQSEQPLREGQLLVQSFVPVQGEAGLLLAVASPRAGPLEADIPGLGRPVVDEPGLAVWQVPAGARAGSVLLHSGGEGLLYHSEPARRS